MTKQLEKATFAGGCFWCMVKPFYEQPGIESVISGYTGGTKGKSLTYKEVCSETTGHYEAVQITFDPSVYPYEKLIGLFWQQIDPTDPGGQFYDRGSSYQTAIFYHDENQRKIAEASKVKLEESGKFSKAIVTPIIPAQTFYQAETYHQHYYKKQPEHYERYSIGSGRKSFLQHHWGKKMNSKEELKQKLSPIQYEVTQNNGTEPAFHNEYWNLKEAGLYVDVVSGNPLFTSKEKFDSGCGWPSFTKPLVEEEVVENLDTSYGMRRIEVRSKKQPILILVMFSMMDPASGLRYCINSASLKFIPVQDLEKVRIRGI